MDFAVALLVNNGGRVAAIWLLLLVLALVALAGLALPRGVRRPRQIFTWLAESAQRKRAEARRRAAGATEFIRYAGEVTVAARGAAATAERRRDECQRAQSDVESAWQAYQRADTALRRARRAAAFATPDLGLEDAERSRALRRAAQAAYRRGDLSDTQLLDALTHRNGWDPRRHPVEQELVLARAAVKHRFAAYQRALDAEQQAWRASDIATAAVRSLRREVTVAAAQADAARSALPQRARGAIRGGRVPATA
jgi:hypothetical protein